MKLQILIPQYKEDEKIIKSLLDSIAVQQGIDLNEVGVIICNDGSDTHLSETFLKSYPFNIDYHICEHGGVSATRNSCLDYATADYVMFCDADDMFFNACGLYIIFNEIERSHFDSFVSAFIEETRFNDNIIYTTHSVDSTFVHGKVHRRQYLLDNNIRWNDNLTVHEDSYFNCLVQKLSKNVSYCPNAFYLWKWRDESVCRHDPLYMNKTFVNMLDSSSELVKQFINRNREEDSIFYVTHMVYDTYFSMNHDRWWTSDGKTYKDITEERFSKYWTDFKYLFEKCDSEKRNQIIISVKNRFFGEGLMMEKITFDDWIKRIENI